MAALFLLKATAVFLIKFISCGRNRNAMLPNGDLKKHNYDIFDKQTMQTKTEYSKEQFLCQTFFCTG